MRAMLKFHNSMLIQMLWWLVSAFATEVTDDGVRCKILNLKYKTPMTNLTIPAAAIYSYINTRLCSAGR